MAQILVVDDEPQICKLLGKLLTEAGHSVDCALDFAQAEAAAQARPPHVLIVDWIIGNECGSELAQRLATRRQAGVVFTTGLPKRMVEASARSIPRSIVLEKPIDLSTLLDAVERVLSA